MRRATCANALTWAAMPKRARNRHHRGPDSSDGVERHVNDRESSATGGRAARVTRRRISDFGDQRIVIRGVGRHVYDVLDEAIGEGQHIRLAYDGKDLELMTTATSTSSSRAFSACS